MMIDYMRRLPNLLIGLIEDKYKILVAWYFVSLRKTISNSCLSYHEPTYALLFNITCKSIFELKLILFKVSHISISLFIRHTSVQNLIHLLKQANIALEPCSTLLL